MTDHYAVIGNPIAQSKSPEIHTMFARATGQDIVYTKLEAPLDGFSDAVLRFRAAGGRGMNVPNIGFSVYRGETPNSLWAAIMRL